jgi:hypothetical protein
MTTRRTPEDHIFDGSAPNEVNLGGVMIGLTIIIGIHDYLHFHYSSPILHLSHVNFTSVLQAQCARGSFGGERSRRIGCVLGPMLLATSISFPPSIILPSSFFLHITSTSQLRPRWCRGPDNRLFHWRDKVSFGNFSETLRTIFEILCHCRKAGIGLCAQLTTITISKDDVLEAILYIDSTMSFCLKAWQNIIMTNK